MFLKSIIERNPHLVKAAVDLHQKGQIPANSWVVDLDTIATNADILATAARKHGLSTYVMTKQHGRNPLISLVAIKRGLHKTVAVDVQCVRLMRRYNVPVGHVGHLNQIPRHEVPFVLAARPEVWTVYSLEQAQYVSAAAQAAGLHQDLMVRVVAPGDVFFEGQEGGIPEDQLIPTVRQIMKLPNVSVVGVTSFPCIRYNRTKDEVVEPTPNLATIRRAAEQMHRELGVEIKQINVPGNTSSWTFPMLKANGATHVEPGHGLLGTTPNHVFIPGLPENPTYVYLSEVSHHVGDEAYCFGGGFWSDVFPPGHVPTALVGRSGDEALAHLVRSIPKDTIIDYHGSVVPAKECQVGATVIFGFRTQMQMTRSNVVVLSGVHSGDPQVVGLFDHAGTMLDRSFDPVSTPEANRRLAEVVARY